MFRDSQAAQGQLESLRQRFHPTVGWPILVSFKFKTIQIKPIYFSINTHITTIN